MAPGLDRMSRRSVEPTACMQWQGQERVPRHALRGGDAGSSNAQCGLILTMLAVTALHGSRCAVRRPIRHRCWHDERVRRRAPLLHTKAMTSAGGLCVSLGQLRVTGQAGTLQCQAPFASRGLPWSTIYCHAKRDESRVPDETYNSIAWIRLQRLNTWSPTAVPDARTVQRSSLTEIGDGRFTYGILV